MKKNLLLLAVLCIAAVPFLFSCNKPDNGGDNKQVVMPDPPSADSAIKIDFKSEADKPKYFDTEPDGTHVEYSIQSIEFSEANRYLITMTVVDTKVSVGDIVTLIGSYTESGGNYKCEGFGSVSVSGTGSNADVSVKPTGEENPEYNGKGNVTETPAPTTTDQKNAVRNWNVKSVLINIVGKGVNISAPFTNGCDLEEIGTWAANNGVSALNSRLGELKGYKVKEITFTGDNTFAISFTGSNTKPVKGSYSLNTSAKTVRFTLPEGNPFFHGSVDGEYDYPADNTMSLSMNTKVEGYDCSLEMILTRVVNN